MDDVLYSSHSISLHITELADEYRTEVRQELIESLENQAVTICPHLWTDPYRQISYLGISVCFTNDKYQFITYDLCCAPFTENDKKVESIIVVSSLFFKVHCYHIIFKLLKKLLNLLE